MKRAKIRTEAEIEEAGGGEGPGTPTPRRYVFTGQPPITKREYDSIVKHARENGIKQQPGTRGWKLAHAQTDGRWAMLNWVDAKVASSKGAK